MKRVRIVPILLAAGPSHAFPIPKPLALFGDRTALEIAIENCRSLELPVVVLGSDAARVRKAIPRSTRVTVNSRWPSGQLSSLLAGLRLVPRDAAFLVYPVDLVLLTKDLVNHLAQAFLKRHSEQTIVIPIHNARDGHPVILAAELRPELQQATTAREVVNRDARRIKNVSVKTDAIWTDFDSPRSYREVQREFLKRTRERRRKISR
ncbi:MAG: nucleotidyltransferase family protein [Candidatus Acidiferrales bacterium]